MSFKFSPQAAILAAYLTVAVGAESLHPCVHDSDCGAGASHGVATAGRDHSCCGHTATESDQTSEPVGGESPDDGDCLVCLWSVMARTADVPAAAVLPLRSELDSACTGGPSQTCRVDRTAHSIRGPPVA